MKKAIFVTVLAMSIFSCFSQETGTLKDPRDGKVYKTIKIGNQWVMAQNLAYKPEKGKYWADTTFFEKNIKVTFILDYSRTHFENGKIYATIKSGDKIELGYSQAKIPKLYNSEATYGCLVFDSTKFFTKNLFDGYLILDSAFFRRYGYLYDFETAQACAIPGWHVPTSRELKEFYKNIDGNATEKYSSLIEGGSSGFNAVLCGWGGVITNNLKTRTIEEQSAGIWSSSRFGTMGTCLDFEGPPALRKGAVRLGLIQSTSGLSVRLFRDN
jgi:uncharacterized protein (TIGR02145 family)